MGIYGCENMIKYDLGINTFCIVQLCGFEHFALETIIFVTLHPLTTYFCHIALLGKNKKACNMTLLNAVSTGKKRDILQYLC